MIVCHCVGVSDAMIRKLIAAGASSLGEITRRSGAGRCCAPCREEIASLLHTSSAAPPSERECAPAECA
jgi:bacterioferritin-associated ferredoxin